MTNNGVKEQVSIKRVAVICSSPNERGIHQYAKTLNTLISNSELILCPWKSGNYVAWEMLGLILSYGKFRRFSHYIFCNSRISPLLWPLVRRDRVTVVVHDLMDTSQGTDGQVERFRLLRWMKTMVNTVLIRHSVRRAGSVIVNSAYTRSGLRAWLGKSLPTVHVLHPPPSFGEVKGTLKRPIVGSYQDRDENSINVLAVAGVTANKSLSDYFTWHREVTEMTDKRVRLTLYGARLRELSLSEREYVVEMAGLIVLKYRERKSVLLSDYLGCDFVISLSSEEGFGIPVADAVGFGIEVIARRIKAYEEQHSSKVGGMHLRLGRDLHECCMMTLGLIEEVKYFSPKYFTAEERLKRYNSYVETYLQRSRAILKGVLTGEHG